MESSSYLCRHPFVNSPATVAQSSLEHSAARNKQGIQYGTHSSNYLWGIP
jgi:hypothetical protein